jgi:uncharacterized protein (DUF983 family)
MALDQAPPAPRDIPRAMWHGLTGRCPKCGKGALFASYLKIADRCDVCGEELHHHRADDAPPYFTMLIVAHIVVGAVLCLERSFAPPSWVHLVIWLPVTLALCLLLLPRVKGVLVGLQWALGMHGFDPAAARDGNGASSPMP